MWGLGEDGGGVYGLFCMGDSDCVVEMVVMEGWEDMVDDVLGVLKGGIVGSDDERVGERGGVFRDDRRFGFMRVGGWGE